MKTYLLTAVVLICGILATGCGGDEKETSYSVVFDAGGGKPVPETQIVESGGVATAPSTNPTKAGYVFMFWHLNGVETAYNFQVPITGNITLQAKWQEEATVEYWQVTWVLNGGAWPSSGDHHATRVAKGGTLSEPATPVKAGNTFDGWYKETALTNKIGFPYDVAAEVTLYAKWKTEAVGTTFTIRNTAEWNSAVNTMKAGGNNKSYTLVIEGAVSVPPTTGVEQGKPSTYTFGEGEKLSVTVMGSGTLALSGKGFLMCLSGRSGLKQKLVIDGPVLQGRSDNSVSLLRLDYADLELKAGKITGNTNNGSGGSGEGGGVYINRGDFAMSGGEISNNICGQTQYHGNGGGVSIFYGNFTMSGGTISGNIGGSGGGVDISDYDFTMTGGVIKGNTARLAVSYGSSVYGGGVSIGSSGSFSKTGGTIYGSDASDADKNKVISYDGTVYIDRGAAVYHPVSTVINTSKDERRESTLGEKDNISTGKDAGWRI